MKKAKQMLLSTLAAIMLSGCLPASAPVNAAPASDIKVFVNERQLKTDVAPYLVPVKNVTMMPFRAVGEAVGAEVSWLQAEKQVVFNKDGQSIRLTLGQSEAEVNGQHVALDSGAQMRNGRTMVPLRFIGESIGLNVQWDGSSRSVMLASTDATGNSGNSGNGNTGSTGNGNTGSTGNGNTGGGAENQQHAQQLRGTWVSTVYNIDWPHDPKKNGFNAEQQKQQYIEMLDTLKESGLNAVFVQVRPTADAFYKSEMLPWSEWLTGKQGQDPGYDPLAFMIEETHKRGMQFHAWFNPYRVSVHSQVEKLTADHPARLNPSWVVKHNGKLLFNPGVPAARTFIKDSIMEVVRNYNIDGVHFDDYFYPYGEDKEPFRDDETYNTYNNGFKSKADWRRNNVNLFVQQMNREIKAIKPNVSFGISPFGVWRNSTLDPTGSNTKAGLSSYDNLYADVRTWIRNGWIDYVAPQVYWHIGHRLASYDTLVDWWVKETAGTNVKLYIGHAAYKLADAKEKDWKSADVLLDQLDYNKQYGTVTGSIFFSAKNLIQNTKNVADELEKHYSRESASQTQ
ncbi:family 10 glycosylhydrolase [Paenibacillus sp. 481]|uniref:family 10 glycosylhydrolase n=1 Tax=Paenibacillus sp. 481 TaxID=2835869 RepID=UPI001E508143|nr:family 10 glycosylhydrolase [Paenibacillus sp. 481]UHA72856.1 family 10 glycosylhydrolase [Paenibacillus sp. 481]